MGEVRFEPLVFKNETDNTKIVCRPPDKSLPMYVCEPTVPKQNINGKFRTDSGIQIECTQGECKITESHERASRIATCPESEPSYGIGHRVLLAASLYDSSREGLPLDGMPR